MTATATVSAAIESLKQSVADGKTEAKHLDGLVRVNDVTGNRGSYVENISTLDDTVALLTETLEFEEKFETDLPPTAFFFKARYFHVKLPTGLIGRTGVKLYGDLTDNERKLVRLVDGAHGPELVMPWQGELEKTSDIWVIVGKEDGMLWTWYPGPITPRQTAELSPDIEKMLAGEVIDDDKVRLINSLAVKLQLS
ncbi:hypothetical protein KBC55_03820 [Patescibacteria group bacterium]|nr:hypothetical protein [Patescibacteria group bacterium]